MYGSTSYIGMGRVQNGILYLVYRSGSVIMEAECCKTFTHKNLHYSIVESAPRLPLTFLNVEKNILEIIFLFFFFLSFFFMQNSKFIGRI